MKFQNACVILVSTLTLSVVSARQLTSPCLAVRANKDFSGENDEYFCSCELQRSDIASGDGYQLVELADAPEDWCVNAITSGSTEILPGGLSIDDDAGQLQIASDESNGLGTNSIGVSTWSDISLSYFDHDDESQSESKSSSDNAESSNSAAWWLRNRHLRRRLRTGTYKVLVLRGVALDSEALEADVLSDKIFGTSGDFVNLKSQYKACSYGQLNFEPMDAVDGVGVNGEGVFETVTNTTVAGKSDSSVRNSMLNIAASDLGPLPGSASHIIVCVPPGTNGNWIAYAFVNHWLSVYNGNWCISPSAMMHEVGHNLNLAHSGDSGNVEYGDISGVMGASFSNDEGPLMCFNAAKTYQLGWFPDYHLDFNSNQNSINWQGDLVGFANKPDIPIDGVNMIIRLIDSTSTGVKRDYYIHFNGAIGFNAGTLEGSNDVMIVSRRSGTNFGESFIEASLNGGESHTISNFGGGDEPLVITAESIELGSIYTSSVSVTWGSTQSLEPTRSPVEEVSNPPYMSLGPTLFPTTSAKPSTIPSAAPSSRLIIVVPSSMPTKSARPSTVPSAAPSTTTSSMPTKSARPSTVPSATPSTTTTSTKPSSAPSKTTTSTKPSSPPTQSLSVEIFEENFENTSGRFAKWGERVVEGIGSVNSDGENSKGVRLWKRQFIESKVETISEYSEFSIKFFFKAFDVDEGEQIRLQVKFLDSNNNGKNNGWVTKWEKTVGSGEGEIVNYIWNEEIVRISNELREGRMRFRFRAISNVRRNQFHIDDVTLTGYLG